MRMIETCLVTMDDETGSIWTEAKNRILNAYKKRDRETQIQIEIFEQRIKELQAVCAAECRDAIAPIEEKMACQLGDRFHRSGTPASASSSSSSSSVRSRGSAVPIPATMLAPTHGSARTPASVAVTPAIGLSNSFEDGNDRLSNSPGDGVNGGDDGLANSLDHSNSRGNGDGDDGRRRDSLGVNGITRSRRSGRNVYSENEHPHGKRKSPKRTQSCAPRQAASGYQTRLVARAPTTEAAAHSPDIATSIPKRTAASSSSSSSSRAEVNEDEYGPCWVIDCPNQWRRDPKTNKMRRFNIPEWARQFPQAFRGGLTPTDATWEGKFACSACGWEIKMVAGKTTPPSCPRPRSQRSGLRKREPTKPGALEAAPTVTAPAAISETLEAAPTVTAPAAISETPPAAIPETQPAAISGTQVSAIASSVEASSVAAIYARANFVSRSSDSHPSALVAAAAMNDADTSPVSASAANPANPANRADVVPDTTEVPRTSIPAGTAPTPGVNPSSPNLTPPVVPLAETAFAAPTASRVAVPAAAAPTPVVVASSQNRAPPIVPLAEANSAASTAQAGAVVPSTTPPPAAGTPDGTPKPAVEPTPIAAVTMSAGTAMMTFADLMHLPSVHHSHHLDSTPPTLEMAHPTPPAHRDDPNKAPSGPRFAHAALPADASTASASAATGRAENNDNNNNNDDDDDNNNKNDDDKTDDSEDEDRGSDKGRNVRRGVKRVRSATIDAATPGRKKGRIGPVTTAQRPSPDSVSTIIVAQPAQRQPPSSGAPITTDAPAQCPPPSNASSSSASPSPVASSSSSTTTTVAPTQRPTASNTSSSSPVTTAAASSSPSLVTIVAPSIQRPLPSNTSSTSSSPVTTAAASSLSSLVTIGAPQTQRPPPSNASSASCSPVTTQRPPRSHASSALSSPVTTQRPPRSNASSALSSPVTTTAPTERSPPSNASSASSLPVTTEAMAPPSASSPSSSSSSSLSGFMVSRPLAPVPSSGEAGFERATIARVTMAVVPLPPGPPPPPARLSPSWDPETAEFIRRAKLAQQTSDLCTFVNRGDVLEQQERTVDYPRHLVVSSAPLPTATPVTGAQHIISGHNGQRQLTAALARQPTFGDSAVHHLHVAPAAASPLEPNVATNSARHRAPAAPPHGSLPPAAPYENALMPTILVNGTVYAPISINAVSTRRPRA
jgi:hypothetical protein